MKDISLREEKMEEEQDTALSEEEKRMLSVGERCLRIAEDYLLTENSGM